VQVVIGNDNAGVESTVNQMVTDYNSLISAVNAQEGKDSSGNPEPLFGSPTLSLLQQQLMNLVNRQNPNGDMTPITVNSSTALSGQVALQVGSGATETFVMGTGASSDSTVYTGSNTLQGLVDAINAAAAYTPVSYSSTASDSGSLTASNTANLAGTLTIQTAGGINQTIYLGSSGNAPAGDLATGSATNTLSSLETYISKNASTLGATASIVDNGDGTSTLSLSSTDASALTVASSVFIPGIGVTAGIATNNGQSTLTLLSQTAGSAGAVTATSTLTATSDTLLEFTGVGGGGGFNASGVLDPIPSASDALSGSLSIQVGSGTALTVTVDSSHNTLQGLADTINATAGIGVTASVVPQSNGTVLLSLKSLTADAAGNLTVTSNVLDKTNTTTTNMTYNNSSDVSGLANLGITVSKTDNGTLTFDASVLDSALNSDFSGVLGFFQDANSWGMNFAAMLDGAGTSSSTAILGLAAKANSTTESTLNAEVSKEQSYISAQQSSLTRELSQANQILQELPSQLQGINELYSAITGYNQVRNG
jgi:flagellar hook-associated protein 2